MRILIAGGTGLIGRPLIRSLVSNSHTVVVLSRSARKFPASSGIEWIAWDAKTTAGWGSIVNDIDGVINLAGENIGRFPWSEKNKYNFRQSRVDAGRALVNAIEECQSKPQLLIQASAVGYYGPHGDELVDESAQVGEDFSAVLCRDWEASTQDVENYGVRRVIIRTGIVLTDTGGVLPQMAMPAKLFMGGRFGSGNQGIPWIHIDDEIRAIQYLLENESTQGVYNLSAPCPVSNKEFMHLIAQILRRPFWFHVPRILLVSVLGEMSSVLLNGQYMVPKRLLDSGFRFKFDQLRPALQDIFVRK